jgi:Cdc6-like AAA superfamily ATPase
MDADFFVTLKFRPDASRLPSFMGRAQQYEILATPRGARPGVSVGYFSPAEVEKDLEDVMIGKENLNVLVAGTSGVGKTTLLDYIAWRLGKPALIFNFKPDDLHLHLGLEVLDASKAAPRLSDLQPVDVITAYLLAYPVYMVGVMASEIPTVLHTALTRAKTWSELPAVLEELRRTSKRSLEKQIADLCRQRFISELLKGIKTASWTWDFKTHTVVDFSTIVHTPARIFWCEIYLRYLWRAARDKRNFVIVIDEAHTIAKKQQNFAGIIDELARQARSLGAVVVAGTQDLSDIHSDILNQFATIFVGKTVHPDDLKIIKGVHPNLIYLLSALGRWEFFDLRQGVGEGGMYDVMVLANTLKSDLPVRYLEIEGEEIAAEAPEAPAESEAAPRPPVRVARNKLKRDILKALGECGACYVSQLARELGVKYRRHGERLKPTVHSILKVLVAQGTVSKAELIDQFNVRKIFFWLCQKGETPLHDVIKDAVFTLTSHLPRLLPVGADHAFELAGKRVAVEAETGLKSDDALKTTFEEQLDKRLRSFDEVWVVVPTPEQKSRFEALFARERVKVMTLPEVKKAVRW